MTDLQRLEQRDYTVKELAGLAGVTPGRVRQLIVDGTLHPTFKRGGARFVPVAVARRWLASRGRR